MSKQLGLLICLMSTGSVILGDYFLKIAADRSLSLRSLEFLVGCTLYAASAVGWYYTMRYVSLGQIGVAFAVFTMLALSVIGVVAFDEELGAREYLGLALAVASLLLMARFI